MEWLELPEEESPRHEVPIWVHPCGKTLVYHMAGPPAGCRIHWYRPEGASRWNSAPCVEGCRFCVDGPPRPAWYIPCLVSAAESDPIAKQFSSPIIHGKTRGRVSEPVLWSRVLLPQPATSISMLTKARGDSWEGLVFKVARGTGHKSWSKLLTLGEAELPCEPFRAEPILERIWSHWLRQEPCENPSLLPWRKAE